MKLLDQIDLERFVMELSRASRRYNVDARLESYSCKMVTEEKRQFKKLSAQFADSSSALLPLGPSQTLLGLYNLTGQPVDPSTYRMSTVQYPQATSTASSSPKREADGAKKRSRSDTSSSEDGTNPSSSTPRKTVTPSIPLKDLFCLMSTLNICFGPAYDFLSARSDEFCLEPELWLVQHYISRFCSIYVDKYEDLAPSLWKTINEEIVSNKCLIYSYRPDHSSDPYSSRCLASFNYFFFNKPLKRILFFSVRILNDSCFVDDEDDGPALY